MERYNNDELGVLYPGAISLAKQPFRFSTTLSIIHLKPSNKLSIPVLLYSLDRLSTINSLQLVHEQEMEYLIYIVTNEDTISPYWSIGTSIASIVIALTAVAFTRFQIKKTDSHNRLMVTPHISSTTHIDSDNGQFSIHLENNGIGPAIIKDFSIEVDGKKVEAEDEVEAAIKLLLNGLPIDRWGHESITRGSFLPAGAKIELATMISTKASPDELIKKIDPRAAVIIEYTSIYGEHFTYKS